MVTRETSPDDSMKLEIFNQLCLLVLIYCLDEERERLHFHDNSIQAARHKPAPSRAESVRMLFFFKSNLKCRIVSRETCITTNSFITLKKVPKRSKIGKVVKSLSNVMT